MGHNAKDIEMQFKRHHLKIFNCMPVESQSIKRVANGQETLPAFLECFPHSFCMTYFSD